MQPINLYNQYTLVIIIKKRKKRKMNIKMPLRLTSRKGGKLGDFDDKNQTNPQNETRDYIEWLAASATSWN